MKLSKFVSAVSVAIVLNACGGGSSSAKTVVDGSPTTPTNPTTPETPTEPTKVTPAPDVSDGTPAGALTRTAAMSNCQLTQATGGFPDRQLSITATRFVQVVEQDMTDPASQLAAEKSVFVRVDVVSPQDVALPSKAVLQIGNSSGSCTSYDLIATNQTAPTIRDATTLSKSYVARISSVDVSSSWADYQVVVDPLRQSTASAASALYATGSLRVRPAVSDKYVYMPISFEGQVGQFATVSELEGLIKRVFPQGSVTTVIEPPRILAALDKEKALRVEGDVYVFDFKIMGKALSEAEFDCLSDYNLGVEQFRFVTKCLAAFPSNIRFVSDSASVLGVATGVAMFSESFTAVDNNSILGPYNGYWLSRGAETFIHEMGHIQSLGHANCGGVDQVDNDLYDDGRLGPIGVGYDSGRDFYFQSARGRFFDMMSYCNNGWMSDKGYRKVISFKSGDNDEQRASARSTSGASESSPRMVYLAKTDGQWRALSFPVPHELKALLPAQVKALLPTVLNGLEVSVYNTDAGPMLDGPYFLSATPEVLSKLKLLGLADSVLRQLVR